MAALFIALILLFTGLILLCQRQAAVVELTDSKLAGTADACRVSGTTQSKTKRARMTQRPVCVHVCVCVHYKIRPSNISLQTSRRQRLQNSWFAAKVVSVYNYSDLYSDTPLVDKLIHLSSFFWSPGTSKIPKFCSKCIATPVKTQPPTTHHPSFS